MNISSNNTKDNKIFKWLFIIELLLMIALPTVLMLFSSARFKFPVILDWHGFLNEIILILIPILAVFLTFIFRRKIKSAIKITVLIAAIAILIFEMFVGFVFSFLAPSFGSYTTDTSNYLVVDNDSYDSIKTFFPQSIPSTAENEKYVYSYKVVVEEMVLITAEWELPEAEFLSEVDRVKTQFPSAQEKELSNGDIGYMISSDTKDIFNVLEFKYNSEKGRVKYIFGYCIDNVGETAFVFNEDTGEIENY